MDTNRVFSYKQETHGSRRIEKRPEEDKGKNAKRVDFCTNSSRNAKEPRHMSIFVFPPKSLRIFAIFDGKSFWYTTRRRFGESHHQVLRSRYNTTAGSRNSSFATRFILTKDKEPSSLSMLLLSQQPVSTPSTLDEIWCIQLEVSQVFV